jgi:hypothetical protein
VFYYVFVILTESVGIGIMRVEMTIMFVSVKGSGDKYSVPKAATVKDKGEEYGYQY